MRYVSTKLTDMQIDVIDDFSSLVNVKEQWKSVYDGDPEAHFFLSWTWMSKWLSDVVSPWIVLAARPDDGAGSYVAFFPLRALSMVAKGQGIFNNLEVACRRTSDRTGLICLPDYDDVAIPAFANALAAMHWANLAIERVGGSDKRFDLLLDGFPSREFKVNSPETTLGGDTTDFSVSLGVDLPSDWETYLTTKLSPTGRRNVRRVLRKVEEDDRFRITYANQDTIERDLDILLKFWASQWGGAYGEGLKFVQQDDRTMIRHCLDEGVLSMPVLWDGDRPICAAANILDFRHRSLLCKLLGRDATFTNPSPGIILIGHSIRHAINLGLDRCEFGQGDHAYKYAFGVEEFHLKSCVIFRKSAANMVDCLDKRWLNWAVALAQQLEKTGHPDEAIKAYRQVLRVDPGKSAARPPLAHLLTQKGHHAAAARVLDGPAQGRGAISGRQDKVGRHTQSKQKTRGTGGRRRK